MNDNHTLDFNHFKLYSDRTLKTFTKDELISYIKMVHNNWSGCDERLFNIMNILQKYYELEKELGCPIEVYIKLTSNKVVWWMNKDGSMRRNLDTDIDYIIINEGEKNIVVLDYEYDDIDGNSAYNIFYFKDYKKTWWLKEDKSE